MATINLGSIKFNWQGAYAGGTAYAIDDVVSSGGSSYVCIAATTGNAPPNATYWELMSQAGSDGTDFGTILTTQGDIVYRDGSGIQRLGAGTSGQALVTQGAGANPIWSNVGGDFSPNFKAYMSSHQSIASVTVTKLTLTAESFDPDSAYDTSTSRFTVPSGKGGKYFVYAQIRKNNFAGSRFELFVDVVGGSTILQAELGNVPDNYNTLSCSSVLELTAGQALEISTYHNDSGARNIYSGETNTFFGAYRLSD